MVESTSPVIWTESYLSITYLIPVDLSPLCTFFGDSFVLFFLFFFYFKNSCLNRIFLMKKIEMRRKVFICAFCNQLSGSNKICSQKNLEIIKESKNTYLNSINIHLFVWHPRKKNQKFKLTSNNYQWQPTQRGQRGEIISLERCSSKERRSDRNWRRHGVDEIAKRNDRTIRACNLREWINV